VRVFQVVAELGKDNDEHQVAADRRKTLSVEAERAFREEQAERVAESHVTASKRRKRTQAANTQHQQASQQATALAPNRKSNKIVRNGTHKKSSFQFALRSRASRTCSHDEIMISESKWAPQERASEAKTSTTTKRLDSQ
jgi:hypothetical protein